jgi:hypothetical protein
VAGIITGGAFDAGGNSDIVFLTWHSFRFSTVDRDWQSWAKAAVDKVVATTITINFVICSYLVFSFRRTLEQSVVVPVGPKTVTLINRPILGRMAGRTLGRLYHAIDEFTAHPIRSLWSGS